LTMPQIILLNHGSQVNKKRMDNRIEADRKNKDKADRKAARNPAVYKGKTLDQLTTQEQSEYYGTFRKEDSSLTMGSRVFTKDN
jgi:hypothetical protein